jgi:hypothetical protein
MVWLAAPPLALDRGVDADNRIAELVEELVEPQHVLAGRSGLPRTHRVFGIKQFSFDGSGAPR